MCWKDGVTLVTSVCSCQDIFVEWVIRATNCMPINASYIIYLNTKSWYFRRLKKTREQAVKHSKGNGAETLRKRKEDLEQKIFITYSSTPGFQFQSSAEVEAPVAIEDELQPDFADEDTTEKHGEGEQHSPSRVDSTDHVPDTTALPVPADVSTNQVNILILLDCKNVILSRQAISPPSHVEILIWLLEQFTSLTVVFAQITLLRRYLTSEITLGIKINMKVSRLSLTANLIWYQFLGWQIPNGNKIGHFSHCTFCLKIAKLEFNV